MIEHIDVNKFESNLNYYNNRTLLNFAITLFQLAENDQDQIVTSQYVFQFFVINHLETRGYPWGRLSFETYVTSSSYEHTEETKTSAKLFPKLPNQIYWSKEFLENIYVWDYAERSIRSLGWNLLQTVEMETHDELIGLADELTLNKINECTSFPELAIAAQLPGKTDQQTEFWSCLLKDVTNRLITISIPSRDELETKQKNLLKWISIDPLYATLAMCKCKNNDGEFDWKQLIEKGIERSKGRVDVKPIIRKIR
jgi:hypothetical protein